jgi:hypothetical protein
VPHAGVVAVHDEELVGGLVAEPFGERALLDGDALALDEPSASDMARRVSTTAPRSGSLMPEVMAEPTREGKPIGRPLARLGMVPPGERRSARAMWCSSRPAAGLLERFERVEAVMTAGTESIQTVDGIGPKTAASIRGALE